MLHDSSDTTHRDTIQKGLQKMIQGLKQKLDYSDLAGTPDDGKRYELLEGELYVAPRPSPMHQQVSKRLQRQLEAYFEDRQLGEVFNAPLDVILTVHDVVAPDLIVVTNDSQISGRAIEGSPTLVVEILSPSTRIHDRTVRARRYAALGVSHYWIVDIESRAIECYRATADKYQLSARHEGDSVLTLPDWPELVVRLADLWR